MRLFRRSPAEPRTSYYSVPMAAEQYERPITEAEVAAAVAGELEQIEPRDPIQQEISDWSYLLDQQRHERVCMSAKRDELTGSINDLDAMIEVREAGLARLKAYAARTELKSEEDCA